MMCLDAAFAVAWVTLFDPKGDLGGIVTVAQEYGLPAALLTLDGSQQSGALDLFLSSLSPDEAAIQVANQLILLAPPTLRAYADQVALQFAQDMLAAAQAAGEQPSTYRIIEALVASESDAAHALGRNLRATADTPVGKLLMGRAERGSGSVLRTTPGIWNIQLPATSDPPVDTPVAEWDIMHRLGVAVQRSVLNHSLHVAGNRQMTGMRKVIRDARGPPHTRDARRGELPEPVRARWTGQQHPPGARLPKTRPASLATRDWSSSWSPCSGSSSSRTPSRTP